MQMAHQGALIVFARAPLAGRVKSRLAADIGATAAAGVYAHLLEHALGIADEANFASRFLYCADDDEREHFLRRLSGNRWQVVVQCRGDLGARMYEAVATGLRAAPFVVLIGSDIADNTAADLEQACRALAADAATSVLGPTADGGYWLIGLSEVRHEWFAGVPWGTDTVASCTEARLRAHGHSVQRLALRRDVDVVGDLTWFSEIR